MTLWSAIPIFVSLACASRPAVSPTTIETGSEPPALVFTGATREVVMARPIVAADAFDEQIQGAAKSFGKFLRSAYHFPPQDDLPKAAAYLLLIRPFAGPLQIGTSESEAVNFNPAACAIDKAMDRLGFSCFKSLLTYDAGGYTFRKNLMRVQSPITILSDGMASQLVTFSVLETVRVNFTDVVRIRKSGLFSPDWVEEADGERPHHVKLLRHDGSELDSFYPPKEVLRALHTLCSNAK